MQQHVLPGDERVVEHEDRIVLVEARRQRIVERRAHDARHHLVGGAAEQLHAGRIHRRDEHHRQIGIVDRHRRVLAEEIVVRQRRRGRDHLGAGDIDAGVGLLLDGDEDVLHLVGGTGAVDRRVHDRVVHEQDVFLRAAVPALARSRRTFRRTGDWRRACSSATPCSRASAPSSRSSCAPRPRWRRAGRSPPRASARRGRICGCSRPSRCRSAQVSTSLVLGSCSAS